jgi:apolipoprotein N-acyltransferase
MKKFLAAFGIVFVLSALLNFVIHGVLLKPLYQQSAQLMRDEADSGAHAMYLMVGFFFFTLGFVWIYARGVEAKPWVGQGLRYGIAVWLIATVSRYSIYYAIQPWPAHVVLMQIVYELVMTLVLGLGVAVVYRT